MQLPSDFKVSYSMGMPVSDESPVIVPSFTVADDLGARDISKDFVVQSTLHNSPGRFGSSYICIRKTDCLACTVQVFDKSRLGGNSKYVEFLKSTRLTQNLNDPTTVMLYDAHENAKKIMLVTEMCCGGELFEGLAGKACREGGYNEELVANVLKQILRAVEHMHSLDISHCDIKPSNIIFSVERQNALLKVVDFEYAQWLPSWKRYLNQHFGTVQYMSAETVEGRFSKEADLWSIGVIMFALFVGCTPFDKANDEHSNKQTKNKTVIKRIREFAGVPHHLIMSREANSLIRHLLTSNLTKRYTAKQALMHKWFNIASSSKKISVGDVLLKLSQNSAIERYKVLVTSEFFESADLSIMTQLKNYFIEDFERNIITIQDFEEGLTKFCPEISVVHIRKNLNIKEDTIFHFDEFLCLIAYWQLDNIITHQWEVFDWLDGNRDECLEDADIQKLKTAIHQDSLASSLEIDPEDVVKSAEQDGRVKLCEFILALHSALVKSQSSKSIKLKSFSRTLRKKISKKRITSTKAGKKIIRRTVSILPQFDIGNISCPGTSAFGDSMFARSETELRDLMFPTFSQVAV